ncbi:MAG: dihydroorotate dehydrogenase electron transfer subunit [Deltaproteobacteria bacterium]|nr:dihydroorotate dehydrogenase electron transfer subunit [Deltaproteobacteria bacterium]
MIEQNTQIIFNKKVASETFLMGLKSSEIVAQARPGQFVMIRVRPGTDPLLRRPFSICTTRGDDLFLILYRVVGKGTAIMSSAGKGERLSVVGPLGRGFELPEPGRKSLLVAGGIGVAPLVFLAQAVKTDVTFMAGYRSSIEMIPMDQVGLGRMDISIATDDGTAGHQGFVTELLESHLAGYSEDHPKIFACGPLPMLKRVAALTNERDIPCQVSLEANMACGLGACQGCAVGASKDSDRTYYHVCRDGPVFNIHALNWESL